MDSFANTASALGDRATAAVDHTANAADKALSSARQMGNAATDHLSNDVDNLRHRAGAAVGSLADEASRLAQRGSDAWRQRSDQVRNQAVQARDSTVGYIQHEPMKAVLIAAAVGAGLMLLGALLSQRGHR